MILNEEQKKGFNTMLAGKNVLITGGAGVGKTELLRFFIAKYKHLKRIAVTSTTGISALLINGTTLHSYLGIGLGTNSAQSIITKIKKKKYLRDRWCLLEVLIIDEISMLSPQLFDKLEEIAQDIRRNSEPFGGIQLIFSGDFCQLPCVDSCDFCFEANTWNTCIKNVIFLTEIIRQIDIDFQKCLNNIRIGNITDDVKTLINSRINAKLENTQGITPTQLYPFNRDVEEINKRNLYKLLENNGQIYEYNLEYKLYGSAKRNKISMEKYKKYCPAAESLELSLNCQVMLVHNLDIENKLVNGSRGVVINFVEDLPVVRFLDGQERIIDYHIWEIEEDDVKLASIEQIPLKLGYAFSIHKSQGSTLDYVIIDLNNIFDYGMAYVALSRVRNIEGLSILGINWQKIKTHPKAINFYKNF